MIFKKFKRVLLHRVLILKIFVFFAIGLMIVFLNLDSSFHITITNGYLGTDRNAGNNNSIPLENIKNKRDLNMTRNIFFVESSFSETNSEVSLNSRQACSIESAALMNPNAQICVIFVTNSKIARSKIIESLMEFANIVFYRLDLSEFSLNTPVENWIKSGAIYETEFLTETISDIVRLLLLWK